MTRIVLAIVVGLIVIVLANAAQPVGAEGPQHPLYDVPVTLAPDGTYAHPEGRACKTWDVDHGDGTCTAQPTAWPDGLYAPNSHVVASHGPAPKYEPHEPCERASPDEDWSDVKIYRNDQNGGGYICHDTDDGWMIQVY